MSVEKNVMYVLCQSRSRFEKSFIVDKNNQKRNLHFIVQSSLNTNLLDDRNATVCILILSFLVIILIVLD